MAGAVVLGVRYRAHVSAVYDKTVGTTVTSRENARYAEVCMVGDDLSPAPVGHRCCDTNQYHSTGQPSIVDPSRWGCLPCPEGAICNGYAYAAMIAQKGWFRLMGDPRKNDVGNRTVGKDENGTTLKMGMGGLEGGWGVNMSILVGVAGYEPGSTYYDEPYETPLFRRCCAETAGGCQRSNMSYAVRDWDPNEYSPCNAKPVCVEWHDLLTLETARVCKKWTYLNFTQDRVYAEDAAGGKALRQCGIHPVYESYGMMCDACVAGYAMEGRKCTQCPTKQEVLIGIVLGVVVFLLGVLGLTGFAYQKCEQTKKEEREARRKAHMLRASTKNVQAPSKDTSSCYDQLAKFKERLGMVMKHIEPKFKIIVSFWQVLSKFKENFPGVGYSQTMLDSNEDLGGFANINFSIFFHIKCGLGNGYANQLVICAVLMMSCFWFLQFLPLAFKYARRGLCCCCRDRQMLAWLWGTGSKRVDVRYMDSVATRLMVYFILFTYPGVSSFILRTWKCKSYNDGTRWLVSDLSFQCDTENYYYLLVFTVFLMFLIILGMPIYIYRRVRQYRYPQNRLYNINSQTGQLEPLRDTNLVIGSLYIDYKPKFWGFEAFEMFRKLLLTSGIGLVATRDPQLQMFVSMIVIILLTVLYAFVRPYASHSDNKLQLMCFLTLTIIFASGMFLSSIDGMQFSNTADAVFDDKTAVAFSKTLREFLLYFQYLPVLLAAVQLMQDPCRDAGCNVDPCGLSQIGMDEPQKMRQRLRSRRRSHKHNKSSGNSGKWKRGSGSSSNADSTTDAGQARRKEGEMGGGGGRSMILGVEMTLASSVDSELVQQELRSGTKKMLWENFRKMEEEWNVVHAEAIDLSRRVTRITGLVRPKKTKSQSARAMNNKSLSTQEIRGTGQGGIQPTRSHSSPDVVNAAAVVLSPKTTEHMFDGGENPSHVHKGNPQVAREVQEAQLIDEACTNLVGSMFELRACELKTPDWSVLIDIERKVRVISKKRFEKKLAMEVLVANQESRRSIETLKEIQRDEAALHPMNYEELVFKCDEGLANALHRLRLEYLQQQYGGGSNGTINEDSEYSGGPSLNQYHEDDARPTFEETRACMDACEVLLLGHGEVTLDFLTQIYPKGELLPSGMDGVGGTMGHRSTRHVRPMPRTWADLVTLEANRLQVPGVPAWKATTEVSAVDEAFAMMDQDGDGVISKEEFAKQAKRVSMIKHIGGGGQARQVGEETKSQAPHGGGVTGAHRTTRRGLGGSLLSTDAGSLDANKNTETRRAKPRELILEPAEADSVRSLRGEDSFVDGEGSGGGGMADIAAAASVMREHNAAGGAPPAVMGSIQELSSPTTSSDGDGGWGRAKEQKEKSESLPSTRGGAAAGALSTRSVDPPRSTRLHVAESSVMDDFDSTPKAAVNGARRRGPFQSSRVSSILESTPKSQGGSSHPKSITSFNSVELCISSEVSTDDEGVEMPTKRVPGGQGGGEEVL